MRIRFTTQDQNQSWQVMRARKLISAHATQAEAMEATINAQLEDRTERVYIRGPERIDIDIVDE